MHYAIYGVKWNYVALADVDCFGANAMPQRCQACTRRVAVPGEFFSEWNTNFDEEGYLIHGKKPSPPKIEHNKTTKFAKRMKYR